MQLPIGHSLVVTLNVISYRFRDIDA